MVYNLIFQLLLFWANNHTYECLLRSPLLNNLLQFSNICRPLQFYRTLRRQGPQSQVPYPVPHQPVSSSPYCRKLPFPLTISETRLYVTLPTRLLVASRLNCLQLSSVSFSYNPGFISIRFDATSTDTSSTISSSLLKYNIVKNKFSFRLMSFLLQPSTVRMVSEYFNPSTVC